MRSDELREIFVFPLNVVLFPGGVLPLRVFEQRYIELTKISLRDNAPFGVCLIREGQEVGAPAVPEAVGTLATIVRWDMPRLGLFSLLVRGGDRFRIVTTRVAANGLVCAEVEPLPAENTDAPVDPACRRILEAVIEKAGAERFPAPIRLDDAAWVAYRLAELLPLELALKQQILELTDAAERFARLRRHLADQGLMDQGTCG